MHIVMMLYFLIVISNSNPQLEVSCDVGWRSLNYALSYSVILAHSDIKLIPRGWGQLWCWMEVSELCLQWWCNASSYVFKMMCEQHYGNKIEIPKNWSNTKYQISPWFLNKYGRNFTFFEAKDAQKSESDQLLFCIIVCVMHMMYQVITCSITASL